MDRSQHDHVPRKSDSMTTSTTWQAAHELAATIPSLYTKERKRQVVRQLLRMLKQATAPKR